jgi:hypothetical protein
MYTNVTLLINENGELVTPQQQQEKLYVTHTFGRSTTVVIPQEYAKQFKLQNANVSIQPIPEKKGILIRSIEEALN